MKNALTILICLFILQAQAQAQTPDSAKITLSAYVETYYSYDFNEPADHNRPGFLYNHNRHNEFNINLAYVKAAYSAENIRANLSLMAGTYANANLAAEPGVLKNIYEANVGVRLSPKVWLDAGILPSHIGFESAISKDCWTLTRGLLAENSPYYESGAKLTVTPNDKWTLSALVMNGWQRIRRVDGNSLPAFGTQILYKPNGKTTLNYSTFIGSDKPDDARLMRVFHNLYGIFQVSDNFGLTAGFDIGTEQKTKGKSDVNVWYTPVLIGKFTLNDQWALAARVEHYNDENGVIIGSEFQTTGYSLNIDYAPRSNALLRLEGRLLQDKNEIFVTESGFTNTNFCVTASMAVAF
ncbi:MAG TPA: porin [Saprospiraceae bacterium]|nr:porin [Saprospiraceae bacterium]HPI06291.1 porin [Saprospiraceae bacterium]